MWDITANLIMFAGAVLACIMVVGMVGFFALMVLVTIADMKKGRRVRTPEETEEALDQMIKYSSQDVEDVLETYRPKGR